MSEISVIVISIMSSTIVSFVMISMFASEFLNKIIKDNDKWIEEVKDLMIDQMKDYFESKDLEG